MAHELVLELTLDAPRDKVFRCWSEPALLQQWFAPKPWIITEVNHEFRPGGRSDIVMQSPEGERYPNYGVFLDIVPNQKIVMTDAFTQGWIPQGRPFMVAEVTFEDASASRPSIAPWRGTGTKRPEEHEAMGFHPGWTQCAMQLQELAQRI
ncbi:MAG: SRPBCC domain-containing protein [Hyphomonadaceae bacterium]